MASSSSFLSKLFASTFSIFGSYRNFSSGERTEASIGSYGWTAAVKKIVSGNSMGMLRHIILCTRKRHVLSSSSDIWFLGICYKVTSDESKDPDNGLAAFSIDFSSRIWMTYREGFEAISDSKFTADANWGCMIRSSQMLIAQALTFHHLGRSWRRSPQKPDDPQYIQILHLFGDSFASSFSIHNLLEAGRAYGLAAGSWVGPYAMCRTWETIIHSVNEQNDLTKEEVTFPMAIYIVSDNEMGERGGAPVICIERAAELCYAFNKGKLTWSPMLLLVPLVLGVENVNPRYIPSLRDTFTFPQSLGILGGKPGASTYIIGVQDDDALFLDPHTVQLAIDFRKQNVEIDTSSYHCNNVHRVPLDLLDPSVAIGFYCRDKGDFDDFCLRASELQDKSDGAPLFTVSQSFRPIMSAFPQDSVEVIDIGDLSSSAANAEEDEWLML